MEVIQLHDLQVHINNNAEPYEIYYKQEKIIMHPLTFKVIKLSIDRNISIGEALKIVKQGQILA